MVRLDPTAWQQKFMTAHSDQVSCLAVSPDRKLVASAQQGRQAAIVVFDAATMAILQVAHPRAALVPGCHPLHTLAFCRDLIVSVEISMSL